MGLSSMIGGLASAAAGWEGEGCRCTCLTLSQDTVQGRPLLSTVPCLWTKPSTGIGPSYRGSKALWTVSLLTKTASAVRRPGGAWVVTWDTLLWGCGANIGHAMAAF